MKKFKRIIAGIFILAVGYGIYYCSVSLPIATGYAAKVLCSAVFVSGRSEKDVTAEDLNFFPLNLVTADVDRRDSSVTCSIFGIAKHKAIYRDGLGATLVNGISEDSLRHQRFSTPHYFIMNQDSVDWPMGDLHAFQLPAHIDHNKISEAVEKVFAGRDTTFINNTRALLVVYNGKIIAERYADGFSANTRLPGWSMTKSITSALVGILVQEGNLNINESAPISEWSEPDDKRRRITTRNLLQQTSGLDFEEVYHKSSDANNMLFREKDAAAFTASHALQYTPGQMFSYSSGNSNLLSRIIRQSIGNERYHSFPYEKLFRRLGMYSAVLEPDPSGTFVGSSFCYATARDWARFGLLYLQKGYYNGEQILPASWIVESTTPAPAAKSGEYGFQWWLNAGGENSGAERIYPKLPRDMFFADGYEGQNIFIIPSANLVIVRLGLTRNKEWGEKEFITQVLSAIKK